MRSAVQFSGGKDSLAVLYLVRERLGPDALVYFGDSGMTYPHITQFVQTTCEKLGLTLKVIRPPVDIALFHAVRGLPADMVPVEASAEMQPYLSSPRKVLLQSGLSCCTAMLWRPLQQALQADGIKTLYRGSKKADAQVGVPDGYVDAQGVLYRSPVWTWSDDEVFTYLKDVGADLPAHYAEVNSSFDCHGCTAWLNHIGAAARLKWTKKTYPELWPQIEARLQLVRETLAREEATIIEALDVAGTRAIQ